MMLRFITLLRRRRCPGCRTRIGHTRTLCPMCTIRLRDDAPDRLRTKLLAALRHRHMEPDRCRAVLVAATAWLRHHPLPATGRHRAGGP